MRIVDLDEQTKPLLCLCLEHWQDDVDMKKAADRRGRAHRIRRGTRAKYDEKEYAPTRHGCHRDVLGGLPLVVRQAKSPSRAPREGVRVGSIRRGDA